MKPVAPVSAISGLAPVGFTAAPGGSGRSQHRRNVWWSQGESNPRPLECHSNVGHFVDFPRLSKTCTKPLVLGSSCSIFFPLVSLDFHFGASPVFPQPILSSERRITKRLVDTLRPRTREFTVWDSKMPGFGVRVRPTGAMSYIVVYRAGSGRGAPVRRYTIAGVGKIAPENARGRARALLGLVAHGHDPAGEKTTERGTPTVAELADRFIAEHVEPKRRPGTVVFYRHILGKIVVPEFGAAKADKVTRAQLAKLHAELRATPFQANRVLAVVGSMYAFGERVGVVPEGTNPTRKIDKFKEGRRERFLSIEELERLGAAIRKAE